MSELTITFSAPRLRGRLLSTVSCLTLLVGAWGAGPSFAAEQTDDRPTVWIELGAQIEKIRGAGDSYSPPFASEVTAAGLESPVDPQRALGQSLGGEGTLTFQPEGSSWKFAASVRYGRANGGSNKHEQTAGGPRPVVVGTYHGYFTPAHGTATFSETRVKNSASNFVLDFQAGRDLGLGLFGAGSEGSLNVGVRFAQFVSKQRVDMNAAPDFYFPTNPIKYAYHRHAYQVTSQIDRSFHGIGPSISWNGFAPVVGDPSNADFTVDWGLNAAVLFGRQKVAGHHQSTVDYYKGKVFQYNSHISHFERSGNPNRSRAVISPNVGGFLGASLRFPNAKLSLGYRADFFFGAMDDGVDARNTENLGFHGPFATISIGLGG